MEMGVLDLEQEKESFVEKINAKRVIIMSWLFGCHNLEARIRIKVNNIKYNAFCYNYFFSFYS